MSYADENKDILNIYGGMLIDDDRQLSTTNYNNINSFSCTKYHHTIKQKPAEKVVEICVLV